MADILLVEDTPILSELYARTLEAEGHQVTIADTGSGALQYLRQNRADLILLDLHLPDMTGMDVLRNLRSAGDETFIVVITAYSSINVAVEAMREGAYDFLAKPFPIERLSVTVRNTLKSRDLNEEVNRLSGNPRASFYGFNGSSPVMQSLYRGIESVSASRVPVFITGESGTGKEVCAEAIHGAGPRADRPFIALNCAAIPRDLVESEIFGHVRGAFTGATQDRTGAASLADGGTLFLDEICEMDLNLQAKLLRFLQDYMVNPVGSSRPRKVDVRIIAASNRDPLEEVESGRFREDLYYRLHVVPIVMPRLADRDRDVIEIARQFLKESAREDNKKLSRFSSEVEEIFLSYSWPGNVRQLQNVIRGIVALNDGHVVTKSMLPLSLLNAGADCEWQESRSDSTIKPLWHIERGAIEEALVFCAGNIHRAAALLEVSPSTLYRKRLNWSDGGTD
jgi:DNA-binding NtrC family response regulator